MLIAAFQPRPFRGFRAFPFCLDGFPDERIAENRLEVGLRRSARPARGKSFLLSLWILYHRQGINTKKEKAKPGAHERPFCAAAAQNGPEANRMAI